jgi:hypothetical protein
VVGLGRAAAKVLNEETLQEEGNLKQSLADFLMEVSLAQHSCFNSMSAAGFHSSFQVLLQPLVLWLFLSVLSSRSESLLNDRSAVSWPNSSFVH